jgi:hypothetical protein
VNSGCRFQLPLVITELAASAPMAILRRPGMLVPTVAVVVCLAVPQVADAQALGAITGVIRDEVGGS